MCVLKDGSWNAMISAHLSGQIFLQILGSVQHIIRQLRKPHLSNKNLWECSIHWYCLNVRIEQSQRFAFKFVRFCEKLTREKQLKWNHFYRLIVLVIAISHKLQQIQMENVDCVHFSQNANISDTCYLYRKQQAPQHLSIILSWSNSCDYFKSQCLHALA